MNMVKLIPAFKEALWGGTKLKENYNKQSNLATIAETWELSDYPNGESTIAQGPYKGLLFSEYLKRLEGKPLGSNCPVQDRLPVLIKLIDAADSLSIQVHPNDDYAMRVEHEPGKTEMWLIMECEEGASLYYGVNRTLSKEELRQRIQDGTLLEVLYEAKVKPGDVFFIASGTIHAIGAGIVICEIQQNSNTTYRVYDFGRTDTNGNSRELHIEKAIDVSGLVPSPSLLDTAQPSESIEGGSRTPLSSCNYFTTVKYNVESVCSLPVSSASFASLLFLEGSGTVFCAGETLSFRKGDSIFVPAQQATVIVTGNCQFVLTTI